eukprot:84938_1
MPADWPLERRYVQRSSRTQQMAHPRLKPTLKEELPPEEIELKLLLEKQKMVKRLEKKRKRKRKSVEANQQYQKCLQIGHWNDDMFSALREHSKWPTRDSSRL